MKKETKSDNGDNIQTLAVIQHAKHKGHYVERDYLHRREGPEWVVVKTGCFTHEPQKLPLSGRIVPMSIGFHLAPEAADAYIRVVRP